MSAARLESRGVAAPHRVSLVLVVGVLALGAASAQSQGDVPGGDLLARSQTGGSTRAKPPLTHRPHRSRPGKLSSPGSGSGSDASSTEPLGETGGLGSSSKSSAASGAATTQLPYTGADTRVVGLLGLALVLLGIGLRLRTADVRR